MPAVTVDDLLVLPRLRDALPDERPRPVREVTSAVAAREGAGFPVWKAFVGKTFAALDPFLMLDQIGPVTYAPREALGAPWHPHRGFETVSYQIDGETAHKDSNGGGGLIADGDTQWMTAGGGILHDELPSERIFNAGGPTHAIQLWVNLPATMKMMAPSYQPIEKTHLTLLTSSDGGALVRLIAGEVAGHDGPGSTHTPITLIHATVEPGAQLTVPWNPAHSALAYILTGSGYAGKELRPVVAHQLVEFGAGDTLTLRAGEEALDVLLLGGQRIAEPVAQYGPFVMNTRAELAQAFEDYQAGRLGTIPATELLHTPE
ncbi:MAG: hypothetical protein RLZ55_1658 [Actinomycetota bacterium]|jgi:redox-sensitive bicupin YhaK (pirin superfamily)